MRRKKEFILTIICSFVWAFLPPHAQSAQGPKIVIVDKHYNFSTVMEGEVVDHTFRVLNQGDQALEIQNVKPG